MSAASEGGCKCQNCVKKLEAACVAGQVPLEDLMRPPADSITAMPPNHVLMSQEHYSKLIDERDAYQQLAYQRDQRAHQLSDEYTRICKEVQEWKAQADMAATNLNRMAEENISLCKEVGLLNKFYSKIGVELAEAKKKLDDIRRYLD